MPPLSPATRRANAQRRFNINRRLQELMNYYAGSYRGRFGRTASVPQANKIRLGMRELAARRIQKARRNQLARRARAISHTRARAPASNIAAAAWHPRRVQHRVNTYGLNSHMRYNA